MAELVKIVERTSAVDVARKDYYDRNAIPIQISYNGTLPNHTWTIRWTYTVPTGKKAIHTLLTDIIFSAVATSGQYAAIMRQYNSTTAGVNQISMLVHYLTTAKATCQTVTAQLFLKAADYINGWTYNDDTISHNFTLGSSFVEFDA